MTSPVGTHGVDPRVARLGIALLARVDDLADELAALIRSRVRFYRTSPVVTQAQVRETCRLNLALVLESLGTGVPVDTEAVRSLGERRAAEAVPLPVLMDALRVGSRFLWDQLAADGLRNGLPPEALVTAASAVWLVQDRLTQAAASGHRAETMRQVLLRDRERSALIDALLGGRIDDPETLWDTAQTLGLSRRGPFVLAAAEVITLGRAPLPSARARLTERGLDSAWWLAPRFHVGIIRLAGPEAADPVEVLRSLATSRVGVSPAFDDLADASRAFRFARLALRGARPAARGYVVAFDRDPLAVAAAGPPAVMTRVAASILAGLDAVAGPERLLLLETLEAWLYGGGSAQAAAQELGCHPNTVRARLRRVAELTGRSPTHPRDLTELAVALQVERRSSRA